MKKKLAYINADSFIHVDLTILAGLAKEYDVLWIPVISEDFTDYTDGFLQEYANNNGITLQIERLSFRQRSLSNFSFYVRVARMINRGGYDWVFTAINSPYWAVISALFLRMPVIQGFHDFQQHSGFNQRTMLQLSAILASLLHKHFVFYSQSQLLLFKKKYPGKHVGYVGMVGLDYGISDIRPRPLNEGIRLLFFGRIDFYKGLDRLISSLEDLSTKDIHPFKLTIRGRGPFWTTCEPLIQHPDLFDVEIRFIENAEIPDLFCAHHFLVLPYRDTTQSGPMMIALHYGIPVIAPSLPAFLEHCHPDNAIIYNDDDLMGALSKCFSLSQAEYDAICENWKQESECCTSEFIVRNYISFFNQI